MDTAISWVHPVKQCWQFIWYCIYQTRVKWLGVSYKWILIVLIDKKTKVQCQDIESIIEDDIYIEYTFTNKVIVNVIS